METQVSLAYTSLHGIHCTTSGRFPKTTEISRRNTSEKDYWLNMSVRKFKNYFLSPRKKKKYVPWNNLNIFLVGSLADKHIPKKYSS